METLLDLLRMVQRRSDGEALRFTNGLRTWRFSSRDLLSRVGGLSRHLVDTGWRKGDRLLLWGHNRPEWVITFWACLSRGIQVVPIDAHSSLPWLRKVQQEVGARALVYGPDKAACQQLDLECLSFEQVNKISSKGGPLSLEEVGPQDIAEIVYTSGTTGQPKGVLHRHSNICANLRPFDREIGRFRRLARPFQPIRFLNLLPLSHMFGQSAGLFIPVLLGGASVFMDALHPASVMATIRREKVSVLVCVPRLLRSLQNFIEDTYDLPPPRPIPPGWLGILRRWWRYREIHRGLGWKFWAHVVGGAPVPQHLENFWSQLGFATLQGYGLTETSPVVAVNHPFSARPGSLGRVLEGQKIALGGDGEILVCGSSVVSGYLQEGREVPAVGPDGWLHTGDIAEMGPDGYLYYKGRKKDVIVTSEGLNVYPEDVESVLNSLEEVRESAIVPLHRSEEDRVHAVLILKDPATGAERGVRMANRQLEAHQRIRSWSLWPEKELPRTASTWKVKRGEIAATVNQEQGGATPQASKPARGELESVLAALLGDSQEALTNDLCLAEDLGLSSLDRVELLSKLESSLGVQLDEEGFAEISTVGELKAQLQATKATLDRDRELDPQLDPRKRSPALASRSTQPEAIRSISFQVKPPRWNQVPPVRWTRALTLHFLILPVFRHYIQVRTEGLSSLEQLEPPVLFAANHLSHLDTVAILSTLPKGWRHRATPAMAQGYFLPHFRPRSFPFRERYKSSLLYFLACALFNAYPLPQHIGGVRQALRYTGELVDHGLCPLVYPEGARSVDGGLSSFKPGIGLLAVRLKTPLVPIHLSGLFEIFSIHHEWPRRGPVTVRFGNPLVFGENADYLQASREIEGAVGRLAEKLQ